MIRENRNPVFWDRVARHPDVWPAISLGQALDIPAIIANPMVTPLRAENGGLFFVQTDGIGRVFEMHTLFTPEGWGREAARAMSEALEMMFSRGAQVITTYDVEGYRRSGPPRSMGFVKAGDFAPTHLGVSLRSWVLTRVSFEASPVAKRGATCH